MSSFWEVIGSVAVVIILISLPWILFGDGAAVNVNETVSELKTASLPYSQVEKYSITVTGQLKTHIIEFSDKKHHHCVIAIGPSGSTSITCEGH